LKTGRQERAGNREGCEEEKDLASRMASPKLSLAHRPTEGKKTVFEHRHWEKNRKIRMCFSELNHHYCDPLPKGKDDGEERDHGQGVQGRQKREGLPLATRCSLGGHTPPGSSGKEKEHEGKKKRGDWPRCGSIPLANT